MQVRTVWCATPLCLPQRCGYPGNECSIKIPWTFETIPPPDVFYDPEAILALIYTSGTTGHPKGVMVTHANVLANVQNFNFWMRYTEGAVYLHAAPIFHIADFPACLRLRLSARAQVTIPKFIRADLLRDG